MSLFRSLFGPTDQLATCSADKSIKLWDVGAGKLLHSLSTIGENIHIKWSPSGQYLVFCNNNNMVSLVQLDPNTTKPHVLKSINFSMDINAIEWERNSERFLLGYQRGTIEVVQVPNLTTVASLPCHSTTIFNVAFDPKYKYIATGAADSVVRLWSTSDMVNVRSFTRLESATCTDKADATEKDGEGAGRTQCRQREKRSLTPIILV